MQIFTVYSLDTGMPRNVLQIPNDVEYTPPTGCELWPGRLTVNQQIVDGAVVDLAAAPSALHRRDPETGEWVLSIDKALSTLAVYRWTKENGGTVWNGWPLHTDRDTRAVAMGEIMNIQAGLRADGEPWKFADGVFRQLTNAEFMQMYSTAGHFVRLCFACESMCQSRIANGEYDIETIWAEEWDDLTAV